MMSIAMSRVGIQPIGYVSLQFLKSLEESLTSVFEGADITLFFKNIAPSPLPIPASAFNQNYSKYHISQFFSLGSYLMSLTEKKLKASNQKLDRLLLVTTVPLYHDMYTPIVYGAADTGSPIALISTSELAISSEEDNLDRVTKEAARFLAYTFGLDECWDPQCILFASQNIEDVDQKNKKICDKCISLLKNSADKKV